VDAVQVEIGRVLPNQLQHLSREMWDFRAPGSLPRSRGSPRRSGGRDLATIRQNAGKPTYDSVDLSPYLAEGAAPRRGLFLLHIRP
jgi:hypothetical protein